MILVDEQLCLSVLADPAAARASLGVDVNEAIAMTWTFHYRLVRALSDEGRTGRITRAAGPGLFIRAVSPPKDQLLVLDPRPTTASAAALSIRHGLNVLAAGLVAAAKHHRAEIVLSEGNVGRSWPRVFGDEEITYRVV